MKNFLIQRKYNGNLPFATAMTVKVVTGPLCSIFYSPVESLFYSYSHKKVLTDIVSNCT